MDPSLHLPSDQRGEADSPVCHTFSCPQKSDSNIQVRSALVRARRAYAHAVHLDPTVRFRVEEVQNRDVN